MRAVSSILLSSRGVCVNREIKLKMLECVQELKGEHTDLQIRSDMGPLVFQLGRDFKCVYMRERASPTLAKKGALSLFSLMRDRF